jgi:hypothetical protein
MSDERIRLSTRNAFTNPVFWLLCGVPMGVCLLALVVSWPLGPGFVDEGGITRVRIAVSLIAFALFWGIMLGGALLVDALHRISDVSDRASSRV